MKINDAFLALHSETFSQNVSISIDTKNKNTTFFLRSYNKGHSDPNNIVTNEKPRPFFYFLQCFKSDF